MALSGQIENLPPLSPVRSDSAELMDLLADWLRALREFSVEAVVILGPDPFGRMDDRQVVATSPVGVADAARTLAQSSDFGARWRHADAPLVAWQHIAKSDPQQAQAWRTQWLAHGFQTVVRVAFPLPAERAFECFMFSPRALHDRTEASALAWSALNIWPSVRRALVRLRSPLTPREVECLALAFEGLTARATAARLTCSERTVNYHLGNAMAKLQADNKMAAIQRACWIGAL
jgi:LuxR family quorum-sensing system transcriptional regulator SolR